MAIVTGGSGGIGEVVAARLAQEGQQVVVHYANNHDRAQHVVARIEESGGTAIALSGDVADERHMRELFDRAEERFGGIDVVVHTAGTLINSLLADLDLNELDRVLRTNVRGTFVVDQLAAQRLRDGGAIINFSTSVIRRSVPTYAAYAASKGAVDVITMILAKELSGGTSRSIPLHPDPPLPQCFSTARKSRPSIWRHVPRRWVASVSPTISPRSLPSSRDPHAG